MLRSLLASDLERWKDAGSRLPVSPSHRLEHVKYDAEAIPSPVTRSEVMLNMQLKGSLLVTNRLSGRRVSVFLLLSRGKTYAHPCKSPRW